MFFFLDAVELISDLLYSRKKENQQHCPNHSEEKNKCRAYLSEWSIQCLELGITFPGSCFFVPGVCRLCSMEKQSGFSTCITKAAQADIYVAS